MTNSATHHDDRRTTGAFRQSWRGDTPRSLLERICRENPTASRSELLKLFEEAVCGNESMISVLIEYWFTHNYVSLLRDLEPEPKRQERRAEAEVRMQRFETEARVIVARAIERKAELKLLGLMLPHGKKLADTTGDECTRLAASVGPWLAALGARVGRAKLVKDVLNEADVRKFYDEQAAGG